MLLTVEHKCSYNEHMYNVSVTEIEDIANKTGISISKLCREAGIARSTFQRWKNGRIQPNYSTYKKITDALAKLIPSQERRGFRMSG